VGIVLYSIKWIDVRAAYSEAVYELRQTEVSRALDEVAGPSDLLGLMRVNRKQMDAYDAMVRSQARGSFLQARSQWRRD
jgi:hypothetical protein